VDNLTILFMKFPYFNVFANYNLITQSAGGPNASVSDLTQAVLRLQNQNQLAVREDYEEAWSTFLAKHPQYQGIQANVLTAFNALKGESPKLERFEAIAQSGVLATNQAYNTQQQEETYRNSLIQTITNGKSFYNLFSRSHGQFRSYSAANLPNESTSRLEELAAEIQTVRQQRNATGTELTQTLREHVDSTGPRMFDPLPDKFTPPGQLTSLDWTYSLLSALKKSTPETLNKLFSRYGSAAINQACQNNLNHKGLK
jgi:hypothetical protein